MAKLKLEIVTPEQKAFSGEVDMVTLPAVDGELGIYPLHVPLITAVAAGEVRILNEGKTSELVIGPGFAEITGDAVEILADSALEEGQVNEQAAEEAMQRAQKALADKSLEADEIADAEAIVARMQAQLRFKHRRR